MANRVGNAVAQLTDEFIDTLSVKELKQHIQRADPFLKVSYGRAKLRMLLRRERDRAVELRDMRIRRRRSAEEPRESSSSPSSMNVRNISTKGSIGSIGGINIQRDTNHTEHAPPAKKARRNDYGDDDDAANYYDGDEPQAAPRSPRGGAARSGRDEEEPMSARGFDSMEDY